MNDKTNFDMKFPAYPIDFNFVLQSGIFRVFLPMDGVDASGRTLLEGRSILYKPTEQEYRICPYPGSRFKNEKLMNVGALSHLMANEDNMVSYICAVLKQMMLNNVLQKPYSVHYTLQHMFQVSYALYKAPLIWLIPFWTKEGNSPLPPPYVASTSKLFQGIYELILNILCDQNFKPRHITPDAILEYAEKNGNLIGSQEVCAGSPARILKFLSYVIPSNSDIHAFEDFDRNLKKQNIKDIINFGSVSWRAETLAVLFNFVRLTVLERQSVKSNDGAQLCASFPNAFRLPELVGKGDVNETFLKAYLIVLSNSENKLGLKKVKMLFNFMISQDTILKSDWKNFLSVALEYLRLCDDDLGAIIDVKGAKNLITPWHLELFWGDLPHKYK